MLAKALRRSALIALWLCAAPAACWSYNITLAWDPNPPSDGPVQYKVYKRSANTAFEPLPGVTAGTSFPIRGLVEGEVVYFAVKAFNAAAYSDFSVEVAYCAMPKLVTKAVPGAPGQAPSLSMTTQLQPGNSYTLEISFDLHAWQPLETFTAEASSRTWVFDTTLYPAAFFRLKAHSLEHASLDTDRLDGILVQLAIPGAFDKSLPLTPRAVVYRRKPRAPRLPASSRAI